MSRTWKFGDRVVLALDEDDPSPSVLPLKVPTRLRQILADPRVAGPVEEALRRSRMKVAVATIDGEAGRKLWGVVRNMRTVEFVVLADGWDGVERLPNVTVERFVESVEGLPWVDPAVWGDDPSEWIAEAMAQIKETGDGGKSRANSRRSRSDAEVVGDAGVDGKSGRGAGR